MQEFSENSPPFDERLRASEERLRLAEAFSGFATFEYSTVSSSWDWSPQTSKLFGIEPDQVAQWERYVFSDDLSKILAALDNAREGRDFHVEFRLRPFEGSLRWIAARGLLAEQPSGTVIRGAAYDISDRKALEVRLLGMNETLEARVAEVREEARFLEVLNQTGVAVAAELDLSRLVQTVTDAGVELTHAEFGAFFYNAKNAAGEAYTLYTISGVPREAFANFPMPRNTAIFDPTFRGRGPLRSDDILADARYGKNAPYNGMPKGHLPVRSYLAVSVVSRTGEVLGGLFFGHAQPRVFNARAERIVTGLAAQAAVAIDNARLYETSQREIDARRRAEEELQQLNEHLEHRAEERAHQLMASQKQLEDTETRFRLLVEGVTDYAICMLDIDGNVVNWNPGAERAKGYTRDEIIGSHFSRFYTPEDRASGIPQKALATAAELGKYESEGWRVRKDGARFWANAVLNAIRNPSGEVVAFAKITRDLTERRAADERARQAQKMEGIGQITGGVAHDFNNLLTIIIGNLETLQRNARAPQPDIPRLERSADNAMRGARRAETLTQRLLAFSRQQPLDPKPVDVPRLVNGMSDLLSRSLGEHITIETVMGGGLWRAHADPNQLEIAILNLAINARDAMPDGGRLTIETANVYLDEKYAVTQAEVVPGQYVLVAVTDNGCGMSADVKARAFDPFFTTKDVGHGTGLGLSQVYGFVKQSRGHIKIYSEVGEGSTVKLYLPRVLSRDLEDEVDAGGSLQASSGEQVLVVEDDPDVRNYTCETLRELGYSVFEAENGRGGLSLLDRNPGICLLFTDVGLPGGMTGRQLADEARRRQPNLKVLFTTGYARNAIVHDGRLDPGVELITKPFTQAALAAKLRDIIDASHERGRILVVEDEILIRMLATDYLEEAGFKVETAGSATEALNKISLVAGGFAALVVDVGLPDRKGNVLVREIRAARPGIPIVFATGQDTADLAETFAHEPNITFVMKPYTADDLLAALGQMRVVGRRE